MVAENLVNFERVILEICGDNLTYPAYHYSSLPHRRGGGRSKKFQMYERSRGIEWLTFVAAAAVGSQGDAGVSSALFHGRESAPGSPVHH